MDCPLISVVIPVYKVEKYLNKCVGSVLAQTYANLEVILVDDGSPDSCPAMCDAFAREDKRIVVIHKENGGLSDARNSGLNIAKGAYISFIDSDDYIAPTMYERMLQHMLVCDADMAICDFCYVDDNYSAIDEANRTSPMKNECLSTEGLLQAICGDKGWYYVTAWNKLYRRELFDKIRFPIRKQHEDEFVIHHLADQCEKIVCINEAFYYYLQRSDSIMGAGNALKSMDYGEALLDRYHYAKQRHNGQLRNNVVTELAYKMEHWIRFCGKSDECYARYMELRKKSRFLLYEKAAWKDYNAKGRVYHRIELLFPKLFIKRSR